MSQYNKIIKRFEKMRKNNSFSLYPGYGGDPSGQHGDIEQYFEQSSPTRPRNKTDMPLIIDRIQLQSPTRDQRAIRVPKGQNMDGKGYQEQGGRYKSPNIRSFLRHTTYVSKSGGSLIDLMGDSRESQNLTQSSSLLPDSMKKKSNQYFNGGHQQNIHSTSYLPNLKSDIIDLDGIANKVQRTASFIEELKKKQFEGRKTLNIHEKTTFTASKTYETERKAEVQKNCTKMKTQGDYKIDDDLGFKRKIYDSYYTPKPETPETSQISYNMEKLKRGYTPNFKKIVSPVHKKLPEKPTAEDFIIEKKLGGGKFGTVYRAYHTKTGTVYALKKIEKKMIKDNMFIDQFIREVKIQSFLKHRNIMELYGVFDDENHIYMILELMQDGNLFSDLKKKKKFEQKQAAEIIKQIASGLCYMQSNGIAHRDLKPQNIVISNGVFKICDFGWATVCHDRRKTYCGTFDYTAPQIFQGSEYDFAVDMWGLGVVAYQILVGKPPFYHISRKASMQHALNVQSKKITFPANLSPSAISFIESLLRKNPQERLNSQDALKHPFLEHVQMSNF